MRTARANARTSADSPDVFKLASGVLDAIADALKEKGIPAERQAYLSRADNAWTIVKRYAWWDAEDLSEEMHAEIAKVKDGGVPAHLKRGSTFSGKAQSAPPPTSNPLPDVEKMSRAELYAAWTRGSELLRAGRSDEGVAAMAAAVGRMAEITGQNHKDIWGVWATTSGVTARLDAMFPAVKSKAIAQAESPQARNDKYLPRAVPGGRGLYRGTWGEYQAWKETHSRTEKSEASRSSVSAGEGKAQNRPQRDSAADAACAKARSEWSNNVADCRASFGDEESYVAFRASVLTGGYRNLGTAGISGNRVTFADYLAWKQNGFKK